ncbi:MAG: HNH endonuclease [Alphaproteobacteria bacterium]|nr:HNH endonuclease [Alphaproteobacteria bacterium]
MNEPGWLDDLKGLLAAHPLAERPYDKIAFVGIGPHGGPLYRVDGDASRLNARNALRRAFERFGGKCFYCDRTMGGDPKPSCTLDHLSPRKPGGGDVLYNLVLACIHCNQRKGRDELVQFSAKRAQAYLHSLADRLTRCLDTVSRDAAGPRPARRPDQAAL